MKVTGQTGFGIRPAGEHLEAGDSAGLEAYQWLECRPEQATIDRGCQSRAGIVRVSHFNPHKYRRKTGSCPLERGAPRILPGNPCARQSSVRLFPDQAFARRSDLSPPPHWISTDLPVN
ncbi:hypothetical protein CS8_074120 [Cupriavidus sp. 8B]